MTAYQAEASPSNALCYEARGFLRAFALMPHSAQVALGAAGLPHLMQRPSSRRLAVSRSRLLGTDVPREVGFTVAVRANVAVLIERLSALAAVLANRFVEEKLVTIAVAAAGDELSNSWVRKVTRVTVGMRFAVVAAVTGETSVPWVWVDNIEGVMALIGRAVGTNALPCGIIVETSMKGANALNALAAIGVVHLGSPQSAGKSAFRALILAHRQHTVKQSNQLISASSSFEAPIAGKSSQP